MCGICGQVLSPGVAPPDIDRMRDALAHRGPDDAGGFVAQGVALGHRRLSIIDLGTGHQPIGNEDETAWIVCNGEIYNYQDLRTQLLARGHRFSTHSDTEVILHLYEDEGPDCVRKLRGMFAFAIWDAKAKRLFAARDRTGQKPFYYVSRPGDFRFASEIKALLAHDPSLAVLDPLALDQYLTLRIIAPPASMFQEVRKLPPAHYLTVDAEGGVRIERYWTLDYDPKLSGSDDDLLEELEERIVDCLRLHMVSDVPVGAFLSGGLDSTLIVALLRHHGLADTLDTFSLGLPYGETDEAPLARLVAERYETRHHERTVTPSLIAELPALVRFLDEPSDPLALCSYLIARMAREHVKVVLGGDGGDELFGGYDRYYGNRYADYYARIPAAVRSYAIGPLLGLMPDGAWYKSKAHQAKWLHRLSYLEGGARYARSLNYFYCGEALRSELYGPAMREATVGARPEAGIGDAYAAAHATDVVDRMLAADSQIRMPDHSVMILDRMTMAHGLEARSPFMDHELAEFTARLPPRMKVRGRQLRWAQRRLGERYLPDPVLRLPKQGFSVALPYMLKDEYRVIFDTFLRDSRLVGDGLFESGPVERLLAEHQSGHADHGNRLWLLCNSEVWYRMYIGGESEADLAGAITARTPTRCPT